MSLLVLCWRQRRYWRPAANDIVAGMSKYLAALATLVVAACSSAYIIITLSGQTRTQALWITGILLTATVLLTAIEMKDDD